MQKHFIILEATRTLHQATLEMFIPGEDNPILTTYGWFLNRVNPLLREELIQRLVLLQTTKTKPKNVKIFDNDIFISLSKKVKVIENGEEIEKVVKVKYNSYRYVYVYDISHTKGEPIPLGTNELDSNDMECLYNKLISFSSIPVYERDLQGGCKGYYNEKNKEIAIKKGMSINDKASVLLHELTHSLYDDFDYSKDRDLSEVFVESVAYIVADHFGLDTSLCSFNYILKWAKGEAKTVLELGNKIQTCANSFIENLEKFEMQELNLAA